MEKTNADPMSASNSTIIFSIDGHTMEALKIACDEFLVSGKDVREFDITLSKKNIEENHADEIFIVTFMGKLSPGKRGLGTENRVPGSVIYFISIKNGKIIEEQGIR